VLIPSGEIGAYHHHHYRFGQKAGQPDFVAAGERLSFSDNDRLFGFLCGVGRIAGQCREVGGLVVVLDPSFKAEKADISFRASTELNSAVANISSVRNYNI
jgi:hypothetical protein